MKPSRLVELVLILAAGGCSVGERQLPISVVDSAGVVVVSNLPLGEDAPPLFRFSPEPVFEVGAGADPDPPLFRVTAVAPLGDGGVAVGMTAPPQVLVFGADGSLSATAGRPGEGPGEFSQVASVVVLGRDSLAVWDSYRRRISVFTRRGELSREVDLSEIAPMAAGGAGSAEYNSGYTRLMAADTDALVLFGEGAITPNGGPGVVRPVLASYRLSLNGDLAGRYGEFPGVEVIQPGGFPLPVGKRTYAVPVDDGLAISTSENTEFKVFGTEGDLRRIVRWPDTDRSVGGEHLDRWTGFVNAQPEMAPLVETLPRPEDFPAHAEMIQGSEGMVWISDYPGPVGIWPIRRGDDAPDMLRPVARVSERRWLGFDRDGAISGELTTPEGFEPYVVDDELVWGVYTDDLDVESVRAYRLERREGT